MPFFVSVSAPKVYFRSIFSLVTILCSLCAGVVAQQAEQTGAVAPRPLITQAIDETQLTTLKGNVHPLARPEFDLGTAPASLPMERMLLVLKRSPDQETTLRQLIDDQQDKNSANYHKWMTPEQFGAQFGPTDSDMQTITTWLQSHGFQVGASKGRTVLEFSGSASQVTEAFHTSIHKYLVNGEQHWANATDPQIPTALVGAVAGVESMNNFPRKPMHVVGGTFQRDKSTGKVEPMQPMFTFPTGCVENNASSNPCFYGVGPYDFATIYDVLPLWNSGINGTGQTIAIVGETNINMQDVTDFRSLFGLPVNNPTVILNGPDPGIGPDEIEADLDLQWSGAVAPNATIDFVVSQSTETTAGIDLSAVYIIENNLAPVMSESYGYCELGLGTAGNQFYNALWQQAAAEGITVFISAGDNGSAGCDNFNAQPPSPAQYGLQVSGFASTPYNIAVGGTDFNDFSNPAAYWSTTNNSTTQASALSYIPEIPWNDSCANPIFSTVGFSTNAETNCNNSQLSNFVIPLGGSGGASNCTTPSGSSPANCAGGYAKPTWQSGQGVPADGKRDIPDVSLFASSGFLGSFYIVCSSDQTNGTCNLNNPYQYFLGVGGTSASSPAFAGIMALVNQQTGQRQGNANYIFYKLATQQPTAFHDINTGTNAMPCQTGTTNCTTKTTGDAYGILGGYSAGTKYDQASGLGSVDANVLVTKWNSVTLLPSTTTLTNVSPLTVTHGQAVSFTATVKPQSGTGTPTGLVSLEGGASSSSDGIAGFSLTNGTFTGSTDMLPGGTYTLKAHYPGDSTYAASDSTGVSVTVNKENSSPQVFLVTFDSSGNILNGNTTTAGYGTPYLLRVNVDNAAGKLCNPVATTGATACPSGTLTLTSNGTSLDGGTYTLNSYGYAEDQIVQLPGGTDSVKAAYAGDSSFNASSTTTAIAITPATTTITQPSVSFAYVGSSATLQATVNTTSNGAGPTGTVTFSANGTALTGSATLSPLSGGSNSYASALATLVTNTNAFPTAGSYTITAAYSGDTNYTTSTSPADNITVKYPALGASLTPSSQTVNAGANASVTALFDSSNKTVYPTGTVTFTLLGNGTSTTFGPVACTNATDSSGYYACQVAASIPVQYSVSIQAQYSGDSNYPQQSSGYVNVNVPDFSLSYPVGSVTLQEGQSQTVSVTINPQYGFTGVVNLSCSGLPAETTCSFNPAQITTSGSSTLTIQTTPLGQVRRRASAEKPRLFWYPASFFLIGACLMFIPASRRRRLAGVAMMLCLVILIPSCGGGNGGGGGNNNNPVPSITSLTPSQMAAGSAGQTLGIVGTGFISSSTVTYNGVSHPATLNGAYLNLALSASDMATTGSFPIVVTNPAPGGGSSSPVNFTVTTGTPLGSFQMGIVGTSGNLTHTGALTLIVQPSSAK
jgi:subtilase family serine protease